MSKLLRYIFFIPILKQVLYLLLAILFVLLTYQLSGQLTRSLGFGVAFYYAYHLWRVSMDYRKAHHRYFSMITTNTFSMDTYQFEISYGYPQGESTHKRSLSVVNKVVYSDNSMIISSGPSLFFVTFGEFIEGSFDEIIDTFKTYPTIKLKQI